jgi:hypothetical protein
MSTDRQQMPLPESEELVVAVLGITDNKMAIAAATILSNREVEWHLCVEVTALYPTTHTSILEQCPFLQQADWILTCQASIHRLLECAYPSHKVRFLELPNAGNIKLSGEENNRDVKRMITDYAKGQQQTVFALNKATSRKEHMSIDEFFDQFKYRPVRS